MSACFGSLVFSFFSSFGRRHRHHRHHRQLRLARKYGEHRLPGCLAANGRARRLLGGRRGFQEATVASTLIARKGRPQPCGVCCVGPRRLGASSLIAKAQWHRQSVLKSDVHGQRLGLLHNQKPGGRALASWRPSLRRSVPFGPLLLRAVLRAALMSRGIAVALLCCGC